MHLIYARMISDKTRVHVQFLALQPSLLQLNKKVRIKN